MGSRTSPQNIRLQLDKHGSVAAQRVAALIDNRARALSNLFPILLQYLPCPTDPDDVIGYLSDPFVASLLLPDPSRRLKIAEADGKANRVTIFNKSGNGLLAWRDRSAILIEAEGGVVSSWSGVRSLTGVGKGKISKHLPNTSNKLASRFFSTMHPNSLELTVFKKGVGHFSTPSRIFMYGQFESEIGKAVDRSSQTVPTKFLKVQFDRVARPKRGSANKKTSQGYFVNCHGYPISQNELYADFPAGANTVCGMALKP